MKSSPIACALLASSLLALFSASPAAAQPTLLVLDPMGDVDPAQAAAIGVALREVGAARGYHVVTPAPGSVIGGLDASRGADLSALAARAGVHRAVAVWAQRSGRRWLLRVGLATSDGSLAVSLIEPAREPLDAAAAGLFDRLLPFPTDPVRGEWAEHPREPQRRSRPIGVIVAGAAILGASWILNFGGGLLGGYHNTWSFFGGSCCGVFDPAWDDFRAASLVPVLGPWIQLAALPDWDNGWPVWLVVDGLLQAAGLVTLLVGIGESVGGGEDEPESPSVALVPRVGAGEAGLELLGRF